MKDKGKQLLLRRVHRALREFPRYNQFLDNAHALELTPIESHILVEIDGSNQCTVATLLTVLRQPKYALSKILRRLETRGLIIPAKNLLDRRSKSLKLSSLGRALLKKFDERANAQLASFHQVSRLTQRQHQQLQRVLEKLADSLDAPVSCVRQNEDPLRPAIRRLTRAFLLFDDDALGSGLNSIQWQALLSIYENYPSITPGLLSHELGIKKALTALTLGVLEEAGLIRRARRVQNKRSIDIVITQAGKRIIQNVEQNAAKQYSSIKILTRADVDVLETWMRSASYFHRVIRHHLSIRQVTSETELSQLRLRMFKSYLDRKNGTIGSEGCLARINLCFVLENQDSIFGVIERESGGKREVVNCFFDGEISNESARLVIACIVDSTLAHRVYLRKGLLELDYSPSLESRSTIQALFQ